MATRRGGISLIKLLEAVFRLYVEWGGRDEDERRTRAVQIALEHDSLDREQTEILQRVASAQVKGAAARGREYLDDAEKADFIVAHHGPVSSNDSVDCLAMADIRKSRKKDPIEPQVWAYVVFKWLKAHWVDPSPSDGYGSQVERLIRNYCAEQVSWDKIHAHRDCTGTLDARSGRPSRQERTTRRPL